MILASLKNKQVFGKRGGLQEKINNVRNICVVIYGTVILKTWQTS